MPDISRITKNLIVVSLISSFMVFWLGSRYLAEALTQFSNAVQLKESVAPEATLFELARQLDVERSMVQRALSGTGHYEDRLEDFQYAFETTRAMVTRASREIRAVNHTALRNNTFRYSAESIHALINDIEDRVEHLDFVTAIIISQAYLPVSQRDETLRMQIFDAYVNLTEAVNTLRKRTQAYPENDHKSVLAAHEIKDVMWVINDSVSQTSSLVEGYLLKSEISETELVNTENLSYRLLQLNDRSRRAVSQLVELKQSKTFDSSTLPDIVADFKLQHGKEFRNHVKKLSTAMSHGNAPSMSVSQWRQIYSTEQSNAKRLADAALSKTLARAHAMEHSAMVRFCTNLILVGICLGVALCSFRVARKIQNQADHDDLTGLMNRRKFRENLLSFIRKSESSKRQKVVLIYLDLKQFKVINDTLGHTRGDLLLKQVAERLNEVAISEMTIARTGGDEFAVACLAQSSVEADQFAHDLKRAFKPSFSIDGSVAAIDCYVGYSIYPDDAHNAEQLQKTSLFALRSAKRTDDIDIQPYDVDLAFQFESRAATERDLRIAINDNQFELYYQPQFNFSLNKVNAVEALIRWNHPSRGHVAPVEFIEIAEDVGLMPAIGNWVFNEACRQVVQWNLIQKIPIRVAVNVSVHQLNQPDFVERIISTMQKHGVQSEWLELEITETVVMGDVKRNVECLEKLKSVGLKIALDDFGTGYSSLSQLQELPLDTLKIDRSFISKIDDSEASMKSVTSTIVSIADTYGLETVAEGIESDNQLHEIRKLGIDVAQGYYYSKPLVQEDVGETISRINMRARSGVDKNPPDADVDVAA